MNKAVIELQNIKRNFQVGDETVHALRGVSFTIREGEFVTIMGTSGSGKSTLLNTLGCLDTPTSGEYLLDGISVRTMSKPQRAVLRNRKIGFVFQSYNLLPKTTAVENVELPLMYNSSVSASERRRRAIEALQAVGLGDRLEHKSNQMSGGQMQRVAIARALVNNPAVILADEATGNLDTRTSFEILVLFQKLHAEGRTIIFVTHNPEIAQYSSRNIVLIQYGALPGRVSVEVPDDIFTMAPPLSFMIFAASWAQKKAPFKLMFISRSHFSSSNSREGIRICTPALLTKISRTFCSFPNLSKQEAILFLSLTSSI